ncbi:MAG TPA: MBL fold metallo-hydrolase [Gammaproteobacteria bacterium]|nr:MBL fold metallo-hydrolase [Gammaproteobacteria bacterium]
MKITFMGATKTVTGSKYLVDTGSKKVLVDCGLFQGHKELTQRNWQHLPVNPHDLEAVILTHAHIDHTGYVPLLVKNGFSKNIYCSFGTKDLCSILLPDSGYLQEEQAKHENAYRHAHTHPQKDLAVPLYTVADAERSLKQFHPYDFDSEIEIPKTAKVTLYPAGHIIGASFVQLKSHGISVLFSGDIGRFNDPVMEPPVFMENADYLVLESTYGNHLHGTTNPLDELCNTITRTLKRSGSIIIPSFAVGRAQIILYLLYQLLKANRIPNIPIYLDSPMAINATELFYKYAAEHRLGKKLSRLVCNIATYINTSDESFALHANHKPKIIISASGMAEGGRILHHIQHYAPNPHNTLLFIGFQVAGTRGDALVKGAKETTIYGEKVPINAEVVMLKNLSAHADYEEILAWLGHFRKPPKKVFLIHGEPESSLNLKTKIEEKFGWTCVIPDYLQVENLN